MLLTMTRTVLTLNRNGAHDGAGMALTMAPEWVLTMNRNTQVAATAVFQAFLMILYAVLSLPHAPI